VAVKVQLVATDSAAHIWADRFYVDLHDLADTQDEITGRLVRSLGAELIADVNRYIEALPPSEWTADDLVMRGRALLARPFSAERRQDALHCFEQAFERDASSVGAMAGIAGILVSNILDGWSGDRDDDAARAEPLLAAVLRDDATHAEAHGYMGALRRIQGRLDDSLVQLEIAVGLTPNSVLAMGQLGLTLMFLGQPEAARPHIERCLRLAPHDRNTPSSQAALGLCTMLLGDVEGAVTWLRRARAGNPLLYYVHAMLAAALALHGELDEAENALRQAVALYPDLASSADLAALLRETSPR